MRHEQRAASTMSRHSKPALVESAARPGSDRPYLAAGRELVRLDPASVVVAEVAVVVAAAAVAAVALLGEIQVPRAQMGCAHAQPPTEILGEARAGVGTGMAAARWTPRQSVCAARAARSRPLPLAAFHHATSHQPQPQSESRCRSHSCNRIVPPCCLRTRFLDPPHHHRGQDDRSERLR